MKISNLSEEQIAQIMRQYYTGGAERKAFIRSLYPKLCNTMDYFIEQSFGKFLTDHGMQSEGRTLTFPVQHWNRIAYYEIKLVDNKPI